MCLYLMRPIVNRYDKTAYETLQHKNVLISVGERRRQKFVRAHVLWPPLWPNKKKMGLSELWPSLSLSFLVFTSKSHRSRFLNRNLHVQILRVPPDYFSHFSHFSHSLQNSQQSTCLFPSFRADLTVLQ